MILIKIGQYTFRLKSIQQIIFYSHFRKSILTNEAIIDILRLNNIDCFIL